MSTPRDKIPLEQSSLSPTAISEHHTTTETPAAVTETNLKMLAGSSTSDILKKSTDVPTEENDEDHSHADSHMPELSPLPLPSVLARPATFNVSMTDGELLPPPAPHSSPRTLITALPSLLRRSEETERTSVVSRSDMPPAPSIDRIGVLGFPPPPDGTMPSLPRAISSMLEDGAGEIPATATDGGIFEPRRRQRQATQHQHSRHFRLDSSLLSRTASEPVTVLAVEPRRITTTTEASSSLTMAMAADSPPRFGSSLMPGSFSFSSAPRTSYSPRLKPLPPPSGTGVGVDSSGTSIETRDITTFMPVPIRPKSSSRAPFARLAPMPTAAAAADPTTVPAISSSPIPIAASRPIYPNILKSKTKPKSKEEDDSKTLSTEELESMSMGTGPETFLTPDLPPPMPLRPRGNRR